MGWSDWQDLGRGVLGAWQLLFTGDPETWSVIQRSLVISLSATLLAMIVGLPVGAWLAIARFRGRGALLALSNAGFGLPPVVVGLALSLSLLRHGPLGALDLRFTPTAVIVAQFILSAPVAISLTASAIMALDPRLRLQLEALGATRRQAIWLLLGEIRLQLLITAMASFGAIVSEVAAATLVGGDLPGSTRTMTAAMMTAAAMGRCDRALAHGFVLLVIVVVAVASLTRMQLREARA